MDICCECREWVIGSFKANVKTRSDQVNKAKLSETERDNLRHSASV